MDVPNPYQYDLLMQLHFSGISPPQLVHNLPLIRTELSSEENQERQLLLRSRIHPHNNAGEQSKYGSINNNFCQPAAYQQQMQQQGVPMMGTGAQQNHAWAQAQHAARMAYLQRSQMNSGQPPPSMSHPHQQYYQQMPSGQQVPPGSQAPPGMYTQPGFSPSYCSEPVNYKQWMQRMQRSALMMMPMFRHESGQGIPQMNPTASTHDPVQSATPVNCTGNESETIPLSLADVGERPPTSKKELGGNAPHRIQQHTRQDVQMHSQKANQEPIVIKRTMGNDGHQEIKHPRLTPPASAHYISTHSNKRDTTIRYDMDGLLIVDVTSSPSANITLDSSTTHQSQKCARSESMSTTCQEANSPEEACSDLKMRLNERLETYRSKGSVSPSGDHHASQGGQFQRVEAYPLSLNDCDPSSPTIVNSSGYYHQTSCQQETCDSVPDDTKIREASIEPPRLTPHPPMRSSPDQDTADLTYLPGPLEQSGLVPKEQVKEQENDHAQTTASHIDSPASGYICHPKKSKIQKKQLERIVKANEVKRPTFHFLDTNGLEDEIVMFEKMNTTRFANKLSDFMSKNNISRVQLAEMTGKK
ncbi:hypothetical protein GCK72_020308 [Caenorhabditis remanei]|uniref:POU-specific atypical domain-containing protein n=1 Tax=Caenorhabditis remanei TaxID=31234 RepID=A0A6A5GGN1_CAERE|nr:hypothetical protein GCK72_020308 [Caenorhabditis remanei]KAF1753751.1 hypothetical protein GCK72_020308 [Caenorhabditis remanei]